MNREEKQKNKKRYAFIYKHAKPYIGTIISGEVCLVTSYMLDVIKPLVFAAIIDQAFYHGDKKFFMLGILIYLVLFIGDILAWMIYAFVWQRVNNKFVFDVRMKLFERVLYAKASFLMNMKTGDVQTRINEDSAELIHIIQRNLLHTLNQIFQYVFSMIMIFSINTSIGLFMLVVIPLTIVLTNFLGDKARRIAEKSATRYGLYVSKAFEFIKGIREIHLLNAERYAKKYIVSNLAKLIRLDIKAARIEFGIAKGNEAINLIAMLGLYALGVVMITNGSLTIGYFIAVTEYFYRLQGNLNWMASNYIQWQKRKIYVDRCNQLLLIPSEKDDERKNILKITQGSVVLENVTFSYEQGREVLDGVSFNVSKGGRAALVGASGTGKSTIAALLAGFFVPDSGRIMVDGQDISKCTYKSIRRNIGIVSQDIFLFEGSIRENVLLGKKNANEQEVIEALIKAGAYEFAMELPDGIDTIMGSLGTGLSGGQKQRIMIARVFLKDPAIVIMDEATSALDAQSEQLMRKAFDELGRGRTTIIIAHRLSTILGCEKVIVLAENKVISVGTHQSLMQSCEHYRGLFEAQYIKDESRHGE